MKAVLMDYTGTIIRQAGPEIEEMIYRVTKSTDFHSVREAMKYWFQNLNELEWKCSGENYEDEDALCLRLLELCKKEHGLQEDHEALHRLNQGLWRNAPLYDDVPYFFDNCELPIYVITNNSKWYVSENLRNKGIRPAEIISADDVKSYKPHPEIFLYALRRAGLSPEEVVHVGDSYYSDVLGAKNAGISAILVDRDGKDAHEDCQKASSLSDILKWL